MDNSDLANEEAATTPERESGPTDAAKLMKKIFVTPEISAPVDVLEATTFFQSATSGTTN